jgi:hypothetical protein
VAASSAWHDLKGAIGDHVNASRPSRPEKDQSGRGSAEMGRETHPLFPSSRMAQTQEALTSFAQVCFCMSSVKKNTFYNIPEHTYKYILTPAKRFLMSYSVHFISHPLVG